MGEPAKKICPIVSAFSEVKDATGYPKCLDNYCAWWTGSACAIQHIGSVLGMVDSNTASPGDSAASIQGAIQKLADKTGLLDDWQTEQGVTKFFQETVGSANLDGLLSDLRDIARMVADQLAKKKVDLGG